VVEWVVICEKNIESVLKVHESAKWRARCGYILSVCLSVFCPATWRHASVRVSRFCQHRLDRLQSIFELHGEDKRSRYICKIYMAGRHDIANVKHFVIWES
jgi:hypothetical protein